MIASDSTFASPETNITQLELAPGSRVADFGAGSGAYTLAAARAVTDRGKVYAVDVQKELLTKLSAHASAEGVGNVEIIWGNLDRVGGSKILDETMDAVIVSNILFQSEDKQSLLLEAKRILRPGGKVLIIDWSESFGGIGPNPAHVVTLEEGKKLLSEAGLSLSKEFNAGAHHWGVVALKT